MDFVRQGHFVSYRYARFVIQLCTLMGIIDALWWCGKGGGSVRSQAEPERVWLNICNHTWSTYVMNIHTIGRLHPDRVMAARICVKEGTVLNKWADNWYSRDCVMMWPSFSPNVFQSIRAHVYVACLKKVQVRRISTLLKQFNTLDSPTALQIICDWRLQFQTQ